MARVKKTKIRWRPSPSTDVIAYRLYWALGGNVSYSSEWETLGRCTEVTLPDEVLSFPLVSGEIELGITAIDRTGNESDMTKFSARFDFLAPDPPTDIKIEAPPQNLC